MQSQGTLNVNITFRLENTTWRDPASHRTKLFNSIHYLYYILEFGFAVVSKWHTCVWSLDEKWVSCVYWNILVLFTKLYCRWASVRGVQKRNFMYKEYIRTYGGGFLSSGASLRFERKILVSNIFNTIFLLF